MAVMVPTKINGKWELLLPDYRAKRPEWETGWEVERINSMVEELQKKSNNIVYDIGTEEGDITAILAHYSDIVMFEPNATVWPSIRAIWNANNLTFPLAFHTGFAGATTDPDWYAPRAGWPGYAFGETIGAHGFRQIDIEQDAETCVDDSPRPPMVRLDDFYHQHGHIPTLITMDVEGAELEVLEGAAWLLSTHKPLVYISVHPDFLSIYHATPKMVHDFMEGLGYNKTHLATDHEEHWFYKYKDAQ